MGVVIRVTNLWKEYEQNGSEKATALAGTNMEIHRGEIVALYGKSGSGKTTLLNMLAGLDQPTRGKVEVGGQDLASLGDKGLTQLRRSSIGFIFQFFNLLPTLTALENVFLSLEFVGTRTSPAPAKPFAQLGLWVKRGAILTSFQAVNSSGWP